jgi:hypothetical protein
MSEALERLKNIGAQKIYEDTHIPVEHVQAMLYESFDGLSKVQFIGFISILEREYGTDLSELREHCNNYFEEQSNQADALTNDTLFKAPSNKKNFTIYYIFGAVILLAIAIFYTLQSTDKPSVAITQKKTITPNLERHIILLENNESDSNQSDENSSEIKNSVEVNTTKEIMKQPAKAIKHSFMLNAKKKVWLGYIDVLTNKKYQKTFVGEFTLDPTKEWLLYFGHGYVDIIIDGKKEKFNDRNTLRLHYEDGKIEKLSLREFKELNRGNAW